jgi:hypothetical protein
MKTHITRHIKLSMDGGYVHAYGYCKCKYYNIRYSVKFYGYVCKYSRMFEELYLNLETTLFEQMIYE